MNGSAFDERKEYSFNLSKLPTWAIMWLEQEGIPRSFIPTELSPEQNHQLEVLTYTMILVSEGHVRPVIKGETVWFEITEKGKREDVEI